MFDFLALITNKKYWLFHSRIICWVLRLKGISVGENFYIEGVPRLKIKGRPQDVVIGNRVSICGDIEISTHRGGKIVIEDNVRFDINMKLFAAEGRTLLIKTGAGAGGSSFEAYGDLTVGESDLFAGWNVIGRPSLINSPLENLSTRATVIGSDVWAGANVVIPYARHIHTGAIVAANAVVVDDVSENFIVAGVPAKVIAERTGKEE